MNSTAELEKVQKANEVVQGPEARRVRLTGLIVTTSIVVGPPIILGLAAILGWASLVNASDLIMAAVLYVFTGFGITVGFHRCFTHRGFVPKRALKIVLAIAGSMALEGGLDCWVAAHRRHHRFSDQAGDPHSPHRYGDGRFNLVRGLLFAHAGWLFVEDPTSVERYAPDIIRDPDLVAISRYFPVIAVSSFALPFLLGYAIGGTLSAAFGAFIWAGIVRVALLHHVTWSVNSLCHTYGTRPCETKDRSTNIKLLALISFGDSWHNIHHAYPSWARHGAMKAQLDPSALLIEMFERRGWVDKVRWPNIALE